MPVDRDFVKMIIKTGETSSAYYISTNGRISFGTLVLLVLRSHNNCRMSSIENAMYDIIIWKGIFRAGRNFQVRCILVNTDLK